jgi:hypothetical protein
MKNPSPEGRVPRFCLWLFNKAFLLFIYVPPFLDHDEYQPSNRPADDTLLVMT